MTAATPQMLLEHYTRERFPHHIADSGPWEIRTNEARDYCAAIPRDPNAGHLPCGYGQPHQVNRMIQNGTITAATP